MTQNTFSDPALGQITHNRGLWWAPVQLPEHDSVDVGLSGSATEPDAEGLSLARDLPTRYASLKAPIEQALFAHYEPFRKAREEGSLPMGAVPEISSAGDVWSHVTLEALNVEPMQWGLTIEIVYVADWDGEHALGARVHDWQLVELCGSV